MTTRRPPPAPAELATLAAETARDAADLVQDRRAGRFGSSTKTSATDLVTDVDRAAEARIVARLTDARPDDGVNGEEGASRPGTSGVVWHIDPIDGTTNFVYGLPGYAVSIAAQVDDQVLAGAVVDPMRDETFTAWQGGGARCNGEPIHCTGEDELARALVATGFSYLPERRARQAEVLSVVLPAVRDIRRLGAASTDLCAVACGRVDAFYERGLQRWDDAAGGLIAVEAGAIVGDLADRDDVERSADPDGMRFTLAANPALFPTLRDLLRAARAGSA